MKDEFIKPYIITVLRNLRQVAFHKLEDIFDF